MNITLWGTRGSLATPGPECVYYGGNTSCVQVTGADGSVLVLDAGTGIRRLGLALPRELERVDILLTHLHMDHLQGLGFFLPLRKPNVRVHIWGPASTTLHLHARLSRYFSPPLFPIFLRDVEAQLTLHEVPRGPIEIGAFQITAALVCHPDPTVGFRIQENDAVVTFLPDHEPALGTRKFPIAPEWTSGYALARDADLLIHDAQYTDAEYVSRVGWGHSAIKDALAFAQLAQVKHLVPFHHDPSHSDQELDELYAQLLEEMQLAFPVTPGKEGAQFEL
ncbi:MAG: MBL fold metallo-hydrolase [Chloroflexota bacterium]|nr:MAG: MBL fold metallo-hydrolase [Chloroflexota bacterium]